MKPLYTVVLEVPGSRGPHRIEQEVAADSFKDALEQVCSTDWDEPDPYGPGGRATVTDAGGVVVRFEVEPRIFHAIREVDAEEYGELAIEESEHG